MAPEPEVPTGTTGTAVRDAPPSALRALVAVALTVLVVIVGATVTLVVWRGSGDSGQKAKVVAADVVPDYDFIIPRGTADLIMRGGTVEIIPSRMVVKVGEVIRIQNQDETAQMMGPFFVGPGQTLVQEFTAPGRMEGNCTVNAEGTIVVAIVEA